MAPVYTSDPALPRRPQDSVPACPLRLWPDETFTHRHSSAWHDVLPGDGVGGRSAATVAILSTQRRKLRAPVAYRISERISGERCERLSHLGRARQALEGECDLIPRGPQGGGATIYRCVRFGAAGRVSGQERPQVGRSPPQLCSRVEQPPLAVIDALKDARRVLAPSSGELVPADQL
jgi:hypothetical protein